MVEDTTNSSLVEEAKKARGSKERRDWRKTFLEAMRRTGNVSTACRTAGIHHATAYRYARRRPNFLDRWKAAEEAGKTNRFEECEGALYRRGVRGVLKPVYQNGKEVGQVREYSDTAAIFLMKTLRPDLYGIGNKGGDGGQTLNFQVNILASGEVYNALMGAAAHTRERQCTQSDVTQVPEGGCPPVEARPHLPLAQPHGESDCNVPVVKQVELKVVEDAKGKQDGEVDPVRECGRD